MTSSFNRLAQGAFILGSARAFEFFIGLLKFKIGAVFLGVSGFGVFNQANFLSNKISILTTLSINEGLVKQIAESSKKQNVRDLILSSLKSYIKLIAIFSFIALTLLTISSNYLTVFIFGDERFISAFWVCLFSLPLLILNSIPYSIMRAFQDTSSIAKVRIISSLTNIFHSIALIYYFGLNGAIISIFLSHLVTVLMQYYFSRKSYFLKYKITIKSILHAKPNYDFQKELFSFSSFGLSIGSYVIVSEFICRAIVIDRLGIEAVGLYSPVILCGTLFTGFVIPSISTYLYSSLCKITNISEISNYLNDAIRLGTLALVPFTIILILLKEQIVVLIFSNDFLESAQYIPYQMIGIIFFVWFSVLGSSFTSTGRIKQHGFFRFFYLTIDIIITYYFVRLYGLWGWTAKYMVSPIMFCLIYFLYCNRFMKVSINTDNIMIMTFLLSAITLLIFSEGHYFNDVQLNFLLGPILIFSFYFFIKEDEKLFLKNYFSRKL